MKYSLGFRASVVRKTQDGSGRTINQVARETGISVVRVIADDKMPEFADENLPVFVQE